MLEQSVSDLDLALNDLGPLAWVLDELRKSLDSANKSLRRFVRDADSARGAELATIDTTALRLARQQLHQSGGALDMVGLAAPATVLRSMEAAVQMFVQQPEKCSEANASKVERSSFALVQYLESLVSGRALSAVELFPQYRDLQELIGADRIHPADLWVSTWDWPKVTLDCEAPIEYSSALRSAMDRAVLQIMKSGDAHASEELRDLCAGLYAGQADPRVKTFWALTAAFFEAMSLGLMPLDMFVKRMPPRILTQYTALSRDDAAISERLVLDLLFFCAQSVPQGKSDKFLSSVKIQCRLTTVKPVTYMVGQFGKFDPSILTQGRKRVAAAKDSWSSLAGGDASKLKSVADHFSLVADTLVRLQPKTQVLATAITGIVDSVVQSGQPPKAELAMEVATSVLYLEAAFEDLDPSDPQLISRITRLAERLDAVRAGGSSQPLESWIEEIYRRVSDKQTMGSVVSELRASLSELERSLDQFFRSPVDKAPLVGVPSQLAQMRGVLSVLGLDDATHAVIAMRERVEQILSTQVDPEKAKAAGTFDNLGNNLGALGFLIDMLSYQPAFAKKLFTFDASIGELKPLMGRAKDAETKEVIQTVETMSAPVPLSVPALVLKTDPLTAPVAVLASVVAETAEDERSPSMTVPIVVAVYEVELDPEMREIFLEEAREVVTTGRTALEVLTSDASDLGEQATLRRAFHTLKGSSRMVGLNAFGEAAWSMEQVLNGWLADQKPFSDALTMLTAQMLDGFDRWIAAIASNTDAPWRPQPFSESADAFRLSGSFLPLMLDAPVEGGVKAEVFVDVSPEASVEGVITAHELEPSSIELLALPVGMPVASSMSAQDEIEAMALFELSEAPARPIADTFAPVYNFNATEPMDLPISPVDEFPSSPASPDSFEFDFDLDLPPQAVDTQDATVPAAASNAQLSAQVGVADDLSDPLDGFILNDELGLDLTEAVAPVVDAFDLDDFVLEELPLDQNDKQIASLQLDLAAPLFAQPDLTPPEIEFSGIDLTSVSGAPSSAHSSFVDAPPLEVLQSIGVDLAPSGPVLQSFAPREERLSQSEVELLPLYGATDDQFKVIGPLRIGLPLFNVFLGEADEWSRRLVAECTEWVADPATGRIDSLVAYAHSLGGSSATVGFLGLSGVSKALEGALSRVASSGFARSKRLDRRLFDEAANDIRRLLHQFAAGILKDPRLGIAGELRNFDPESSLVGLDDAQVEPIESSGYGALETGNVEVSNVSSGESELAQFSASEFGALQAFTLPEEPSLVVEPSTAKIDFQTNDRILQEQGSSAAPDVGSSFGPSNAIIKAEVYAPIAPVSTMPNEATLAATGAAAIGASIAVATGIAFFGSSNGNLTVEQPIAGGADRASSVVFDIDDEIDAIDAVDLDLFPIFEEEAQELLPALSSSLRQWLERPDNRSARSEVLRALHTLKGSARLAGALRVGEMSHRMESDIEGFDSHAPHPTQINGILISFDSLQAAFDGLRKSDALTYAVAAVVATPVRAEGLRAVDAVAALVPGNIEVRNEPVKASVALTEKTASLASLALAAPALGSAAAGHTVRVRADLLDRLLNQTGEVMITRSRLEAELSQLRFSITDLTTNLDKMRNQLRDIELQAETQMQSRQALAKEASADFDPLEFDRFTRFQEITRSMAESVNDVATVQRTILRTVEATEDDLIAQARQTRDLQRDLLKTRMVEFEGISERLYRVVRQASKDTGKMVKLDIIGGSIELDRGVLDRMTPAFEHLLRNCVAHGIESAAVREANGKVSSGEIVISLAQEGNDISVQFADDGAGLNIAKIAEKAHAQGLIGSDATVSDEDAAHLIFLPGFSTADQVSELSGRGIGMDVVRSEVTALGGRIQTTSITGKGTTFKMVMPLTTAVTQVVMMRIGASAIGVPSNVVEVVRRATPKELDHAYNTGTYDFAGEQVPFYWSGTLLQASGRSTEPQGRTIPVVVFRSAAQRVAMHVDEVLGNQEVVVKNLGTQLSRLPGLAGMSVLASGAVVLIYNPVALAAVYGTQARSMGADKALPQMLESVAMQPSNSDAIVGVQANVKPAIPLVMVVDDSITVRRVTQRLLAREGYRVVLAADGLQALEKLQDEVPSVVLSDIEMPRMDGFDLARNIRMDNIYCDLPIIMITSRIAEKHKEHANELGVNHYLGKPYAEDELLSLVRRYCFETEAA